MRTDYLFEDNHRPVLKSESNLRFHLKDQRKSNLFLCSKDLRQVNLLNKLQCQGKLHLCRKELREVNLLNKLQCQGKLNLCRKELRQVNLLNKLHHQGKLHLLSKKQSQLNLLLLSRSKRHNQKFLRKNQ